MSPLMILACPSNKLIGGNIGVQGAHPATGTCTIGCSAVIGRSAGIFNL
jgi:hypothetical protein